MWISFLLERNGIFMEVINVSYAYFGKTVKKELGW